LAHRAAAQGTIARSAEVPMVGSSDGVGAAGCKAPMHLGSKAMHGLVACHGARNGPH